MRILSIWPWCMYDIHVCPGFLRNDRSVIITLLLLTVIQRSCRITAIWVTVGQKPIDTHISLMLYIQIFCILPFTVTHVELTPDMFEEKHYCRHFLREEYSTICTLKSVNSAGCMPVFLVSLSTGLKYAFGIFIIKTLLQWGMKHHTNVYKMASSWGFLMRSLCLNTKPPLVDSWFKNLVSQ